MDPLTLPQQLDQRDQDRLKAYQENLAFYGGAQWVGSAGRRERRLTFNYARTFAHKLTAYLMAGLTMGVEPSDGSPEAADRAAAIAQKVLMALSEENALEEMDFETELDTAILGDGCYKVTREGPDLAIPFR